MEAFERNPKSFEDKLSQSIKLSQLISDDSFKQFVDLIDLQSDPEKQLEKFSNLIEIIDQHIQNMKEKIFLGREMFKLFEFNAK